MLQYFSGNIRVWRSLVARLNGVQEAAGSIPVTRTILNRLLGFETGGFCNLYGRYDRFRATATVILDHNITKPLLFLVISMDLTV